jgi:hypothetical protein
MILDLIKNNLAASYEEQNRRKEICKRCENYKIFYCAHCGCSISLKTKLKNANCPINKWGKTDAI